MKGTLAVSVIACLASFTLGAQTPDTRIYDQIASVANKTVVDYFLLCPDIIAKAGDHGHLGRLGLAAEDDTLDTKGADLAFRKGLLVKGGEAPGIVVTSVIVDVANAYIRIYGTNPGNYEFSLVFVYFERADKSRIPALTYHDTATGEVDDTHIFFDLRTGSWKPIPDVRILPPISEEALIPYAGSGDASNTAWALDLPRFGTTIRFLPRRCPHWRTRATSPRDRSPPRTSSL